MPITLARRNRVDVPSIVDGFTGAAVQAVIDRLYAAGGGVVKLRDGTYTCSALTLRDKVVVEGNSASILDFSAKGSFSNADGMILTAGGGISNVVTVTADVAAGAVGIPVSSIVGFEPNDIVMIRSTEIVFGEASIGEIAHVQWADSGFVYVKHPLAFAYTVAGQTVQLVKITTVTGGMRNLTIKGAGINPASLPDPVYTGVPPGASEGGPGNVRGDLGIEVRYGRDFVFENLKFVGVEYRCITLFTCYGTRVSGSTFDFDSINQLSQYGVAIFAANADTVVNNNTFRNGRHHVTTLSSPDLTRDYARGMPVGVVIDGNTSLGSWVYPLDTHRGGSNVTITGNRVSSLSGGIEVRTPNSVVTGNHIILPTVASVPGISPAHGIACYFQGGSLAVTGNVVFGGNIGILVSGQTLTKPDITITGNVLKGFVGNGIYGEDLVGLSVTANVLGPASGAPTSLIRLDDCKNGTISGNVLTCNAAGSQFGIFVSGTALGDFTGFAIFGNTTIKSGGAGAITGIGWDNEVTDCVVGPNHAVSGVTPYSAGTSLTVKVMDGDARTLTVAGGVLTLPSGPPTMVVLADTEGGAASDDIDTISGAAGVNLVVVRSVNGARDIVMKDGTGNLSLAGDFTLATNAYTITLIKVGSLWFEVARSVN